MGQTSMTIRMDEMLKKDFAEVCDAMGMSMSTAFTVFAKAVVDEEGIPFEVKARKSEEDRMFREASAFVDAHIDAFKALAE